MYSPPTVMIKRVITRLATRLAAIKLETCCSSRSGMVQTTTTRRACKQSSDQSKLGNPPGSEAMAGRWPQLSPS